MRKKGEKKFIVFFFFRNRQHKNKNDYKKKKDLLRLYETNRRINTNKTRKTSSGNEIYFCMSECVYFIFEDLCSNIDIGFL
jgi:hypothetical protein